MLFPFAMSATRWKITIEYKGTAYCGWQRQDGMPSIQQDIEDAIEAFCQQKITLYAAGRTDSGVHAKGQVAHFDLDYGERPLGGYNLAKALNAHLRPAPITIVKAEAVDAEFSARYDAVNKLYLYRIINRPAPPPLEAELVWHYKKTLDVAAMHEAAQVLTGHHDFTSFRDTHCQAKSPERTLDRLDVSARAYDDYGGVEIMVETEARAFLHHQVRNMVGSLTLIGTGKWTKEDLQDALAAKDRAAGGPTCPSDGLYLMRVDY